MNVSFLLPAQIIKPGGKVDVGVPSVLKAGEEGMYKTKDLYKELCPANKWGQNKKRSRKFWRVWSDRDNNVVYDDAKKGSIAKKKLQFGERVTIAYIKNDMALVYTDDVGLEWPSISTHPKSIGWVPMDHLLLWDRCPTDEFYVQRKALIAIHLNAIGHNVKNYRYTSPDGESNPQALTMDMNFYFIMKTEGRRALLCRHPTVYNRGENLYGWVDISNFTPLYQRVYLEANWEPEFVERYKGKSVSVYSEPNRISGSRFSFEYGKDNGDPNEAYKYRWDPNFIRFPILDPIKENDEWAHCTAIIYPEIDCNAEENGFLLDILGKDLYDRIRKVRGTYTYDGYVPLKAPSGDDYWHYVIGITPDELMQIIKNLAPAYNAAKEEEGDERDKQREAIRALVKNMTGQNDDKQIDNMRMNELQQLVWGINVPADYSKRTLSEITNDKKVQRIEFIGILKRFAKKYENLKKILNGGYRYKTVFGSDSPFHYGNTFYWIPIEDLPLNEY